MIQIRDGQDNNYRTTVQNLLRYEDNNIEYYGECDQLKRVLTHPVAGEMKD